MIKIYGKNCISEALKANAPIKKIFIQKNDNNSLKILERVKEKNIPYELVDKEFLNKNFTNNNQGLGAYREDYKTYDLDYVLNNNCKRVLILDGIADPHNFGAILRSVDAFGFDAVILGNNRSVPITEVVAHTSTGAIEYTPIIYVNSLLTAVKKLKENSFWIVGTDASGNKTPTEIDKDLNLAIIIGSEGFGMTRTLVKESDFIVKIPMKGHVNSLNASVSTGIILSLFM